MASSILELYIDLYLQQEDRKSASKVIHKLLSKRGHPLLTSRRIDLTPDQKNDLCFWPVENSNGIDDEGLQAYKQALQQQCNASPFQEPLSLLKFRDLVVQLSRGGELNRSDLVVETATICQSLRDKYKASNESTSGLNFLSLDDLRRVYEKCLSRDEIFRPENFEDSVQFLHDNGVLTRYASATASLDLRALVILSPSWLLSTLSYIIRDPEKQQHDIDLYLDEEHKTELFERGWSKLGGNF
jgi:hypothetical protein